MATFEHYRQVIPEGWASIAMIHTCATVPDNIVCTFGFGGSVYTPTQADLDALVGHWEDNMLPLFADEITLVKGTATVAEGLAFESFSGAAGTSVSDGVAVSAAAIIEKRTGVPGRRNRGRMFIPAILEASTDIGGHLTPARIAVIQAAATQFLTDVGTIDVDAEMMILHSKGWDGDVEPPDPGNAPDPRVVTNLIVNPLVGTQRRRLR